MFLSFSLSYLCSHNYLLFQVRCEDLCTMIARWTSFFLGSGIEKGADQNNIMGVRKRKWMSSKKGLDYLIFTQISACQYISKYTDRVNKTLTIFEGRILFYSNTFLVLFSCCWHNARVLFGMCAKEMLALPGERRYMSLSSCPSGGPQLHGILIVSTCQYQKGTISHGGDSMWEVEWGNL